MMTQFNFIRASARRTAPALASAAAALLAATGCSTSVGQDRLADRLGSIAVEKAADEPGEQSAAKERRESLLQLADLLEQMYVFPEIGAQYAAYLRADAARLARTSDEPEAFAQTVTAALLAIHKDGHLRLEVRDQEVASGPDGGAAQMPPLPVSFVASTPLGDGIQYMRFDSFWGEGEANQALQKLLEPGQEPRSLIIDLRHHRGGGLSEIDFLFSHLLDQPTDLLVMEIRRKIFEMEGGPFGEGPNFQLIESPEASVRLMHRANPSNPPKLTDTKLILLISPTTGSAAEHLALAVKTTGRGILIGENTLGAGHFGGMIPLGETFQAFVPAGRTYDPRTGDGWEGVGVSPDIQTNSDGALVKALMHLGLSAEEAERREIIVEAIVEARGIEPKAR